MPAPRLHRPCVAGVPVTLVPVLLAVAACGEPAPGDADGGLAAAGPGDGVRVVEIEMLDNEFAPDRVVVVAGETVRFVFTNDGTVPHDGIIGDEAAQIAHEAEMRAAEQPADDQHPTMDHDHSTDTGTADHEHPTGEPGDHEHPAGTGPHAHGTSASGPGGAITVPPGGTGDLTYTFATGEEVVIGCHEPGHYAAGMRLVLDITGP